MSEEYQVIDLGPVVGADGGFGNVTSEYVNDGGDPGVEITMTGEDRAKDFHFAFKNLVNDPLTASEVERIAAGEMVNSSNTANGTSMSLFFAELSKLFAGIAHTHDAKDIVSGEIGAALIGEAAVGADELADNAVTADKIADNAVGTQQLAQSVRDSLSQAAFYAPSSDYIRDLNDHLEGVAVYNTTTLNAPDGLPYGLCICFANVPAAMVTDYRWAVQIALPTTGYPMFRRKVNKGEWTSWLPMSRPAA